MSDHQDANEPLGVKEIPVIPLLPWLLYRMKRKCDERRARRQRENSQDRSSRINALATIVIAAFSGVTLFVAVASAIISNGQLNAIRATDQTTKESFTAVQRAFVFGKELIVRYDTSLMIYWRFAVRVVNSGNTPTQGMDYLSISDRSDPGDPEDIFKITPKYVYGSPPSIIQRRSGDILGPHDDFILTGSETGIPGSAIAKMAEARQNYWVRGVIHYRDVFKDTAEHVTKFCFAAVPYKDGQETKVGVQRCLYWNCTDNDCKDDRERFDHDLAVLNPDLKKSVK